MDMESLRRRSQGEEAMTEKNKELCRGCRDDYYNSGSGECWSYKNASVVQRYKIGWWVAPTQPGAFSKVETLSCHHAPGKYALQERLPDCAKK